MQESLQDGTCYSVSSSLYSTELSNVHDQLPANPAANLQHNPTQLPHPPPLPPAGSAITGPVAKECADLWPRVAAAANSIV